MKKRHMFIGSDPANTPLDHLSNISKLVKEYKPSSIEIRVDIDKKSVKVT